MPLQGVDGTRSDSSPLVWSGRVGESRWSLISNTVKYGTLMPAALDLCKRPETYVQVRVTRKFVNPRCRFSACIRLPAP